jgi:hypothetical protein
LDLKRHVVAEKNNGTQYAHFIFMKKVIFG